MCIPLDLSLIDPASEKITPPIAVADRLRTAGPRRELVQDLKPIHCTIESELARRFWHAAGNRVFVEDQVPYTINNDSFLSDRTARILFASCEEVSSDGVICALELGAGIGLHARYLLDCFRALCESQDRDYYARLCMFVTDASASTVASWAGAGMFAPHASHVVLGVCDARHPNAIRTLDGEEIAVPPLQAVFLNYVLDVLPATVVRYREPGWEELKVRTYLPPDFRQEGDVALLDETEHGPLLDAHELRRVSDLMNAFEFEAEFVATEEPRFAEFLPRDGSTVQVNFGALDCLEQCAYMLTDSGFVLVNDYGSAGAEAQPQSAGTDRFGLTIASGLNLDLLQQSLTAAGWAVTAPLDEAAVPIYARLMHRTSGERMQAVFEGCFDAAVYRAAAAQLDAARRDLQAGALHRAMQSYATALAERPRDWCLLGEIAEVVSGHLSDPAAALEVVDAALDINPWFSPSLWNIRGDALFSLGRVREAHDAYLTALRISSHDARTNFNLAFTFLQMGEFGDALRAIAEALNADRQGVYRTQILAKQQEILDRISTIQASAQAAAYRRSYILTQPQG